MAIRPNNLTPRQPLRKPTDPNQLTGNIVNPPSIPQFGGAEAVINSVSKSPYGTITPAGRGPRTSVTNATR